MGWPFADAFVARLLQNDIPQRVHLATAEFGFIAIPKSDSSVSELWILAAIAGSIRVASTIPTSHWWPLIQRSKTEAMARALSGNLVDEAALLALQGLCHDVLFLDVYTTSLKAISVYTACGFENITPQPMADPDAGGAMYYVMAKSVAISRVGNPPS